MVLPLLSLCARVVVSDHSSSPCWLRRVPRELFGPLLEAAFAACRPLAVGELVQRWPERTLRVGGRRKPGQTSPNRLCVKALLGAVVRGLSDQKCALQVLDLCGLEVDEGMGGWSLTKALCSMVILAKAGSHAHDDEARKDVQLRILSEEGLIRARRRMEIERKKENMTTGKASRKKEIQGKDVEAEVLVHVRADLFVYATSWDHVDVALSTRGPLKLQCRYLCVDEICLPQSIYLIELLPRQSLLGIDLRNCSLRMPSLAKMLSLLSTFPALKSLRLDCRYLSTGVKNLSQGLAQLQELRRLRLSELGLPGKLHVLLSSLPNPLEILELPFLSLSPSDLAYLSCSHHACTLQKLELTESPLDENTLPSIQRLLAKASSSLQHLCLVGCGLTDGLLVLLLPSLGGCRALKSLALALNPLSVTGLMDLVKMAVRMPSLRQLLYPHPLEDYQPGLPDLPSMRQLLGRSLKDTAAISATSSQLQRLLVDSRRTDLFLTCDLLNYDKDLVV